MKDDKFVLVQEGQISPSALIYSYLEKYDGTRLYIYISKLTFMASTCYSLKSNIFVSNILSRVKLISHW